MQIRKCLTLCGSMLLMFLPLVACSSYSTGERVEGNYKNMGKWYPATINGEDNRYLKLLEYDDGITEWTSLVRKLPKLTQDLTEAKEASPRDHAQRNVQKTPPATPKPETSKSPRSDVVAQPRDLAQVLCQGEAAGTSPHNSDKSPRNAAQRHNIAQQSPRNAAQQSPRNVAQPRGIAKANVSPRDVAQVPCAKAGPPASHKPVTNESPHTVTQPRGIDQAEDLAQVLASKKSPPTSYLTPTNLDEAKEIMRHLNEDENTPRALRRAKQSLPDLAQATIRNFKFTPVQSTKAERPRNLAQAKEVFRKLAEELAQPKKPFKMRSPISQKPVVPKSKSADLDKTSQVLPEDDDGSRTIWMNCDECINKFPKIVNVPLRGLVIRFRANTSHEAIVLNYDKAKKEIRFRWTPTGSRPGLEENWVSKDFVQHFQFKVIMNGDQVDRLTAEELS